MNLNTLVLNKASLVSIDIEKKLNTKIAQMLNNLI